MTDILRNRRGRFCVAWFGFALLLGGLFLAGRSGAAEPAKSKEKPAAEDIFSEGLIPRIRIQISGAGLDSLRQRPRTYVPATLREGNVVYTNVAIRLKGGPGSFRSLDDKPAFTLNFDRLAEGQKFHGLKKLHLNNSVQDSTYLAEKISRELFNAADVPAPRAGHATVEINGEALGLYVLIEGINKQFLHRYFKDPKGNVYDGHSGNDVNRPMRVCSGENPKDQSRLRDLAAAALEPNLETRLAALQKTLDIDRFLSFMAVEVLICHWDGYCLARNNFRIFHDRDKNRMVFIPQGADQVFQRQNIPINSQMAGLIARSVMEVPELRQRYRERMAQLVTNVFNVPAITSHLHAVATNVEPKLALFDPPAGEGYLRRVTGFGRRIQQRFGQLERQVAPASVVAAKLDRPEMISLTNWQPQTDLGTARLTQDKDGDKTWLHITAQESCAASWRTRVLLERGQYHLEGRIKLRGVVLDEQDAKAGAGLRISRRKFSRKLSGDTDWTTTSFDFDVGEEQADVEIVCELRAAQGEAWFDPGSLRLSRK